jgi:hypothetical protein
MLKQLRKSPLPAGWKVYVSRSTGKPYWHHKETNTTQWNAPATETSQPTDSNQHRAGRSGAGESVVAPVAVSTSVENSENVEEQAATGPQSASTAPDGLSSTSPSVGQVEAVEPAITGAADSMRKHEQGVGAGSAPAETPAREHKVEAAPTAPLDIFSLVAEAAVKEQEAKAASPDRSNERSLAKSVTSTGDGKWWEPLANEPFSLHGSAQPGGGPLGSSSPHSIASPQAGAEASGTPLTAAAGVRHGRSTAISTPLAGPEEEGEWQGAETPSLPTPHAERRFAGAPTPAGQKESARETAAGSTGAGHSDAGGPQAMEVDGGAVASPPRAASPHRAAPDRDARAREEELVSRGEWLTTAQEYAAAGDAAAAVRVVPGLPGACAHSVLAAPRPVTSPLREPEHPVSDSCRRAHTLHATRSGRWWCSCACRRWGRK